jgi:hypothetical protein
MTRATQTVLSTRKSFAGRCGALLLALGSLSTVARGTVLFFETDTGAALSGVIDGYGDNVTALTQGGFGYGATYGFTPDVTVDYGTSGAGQALPWDTAYGDLSQVLYADEGDFFELTLTAAGDNNVVLYGFDLAGWPSTDYTINGVYVLDGSGVALFTELNAYIHGDNTGPLRTSYTFANPLVAPVLRVRFDALNLGSSSDNIGIDNVAFAQAAIPEPASAAVLVALGALGMAAVVRRRVVG